MPALTRRQFTRGLGAGLGALAAGSLGGLARAAEGLGRAAARQVGSPGAPYRGPAVFIIRFGGGCRRQETLLPEGTYSPFLLHELVPRGTLYNRMELAQLEGVETSHGQGTLNILTGMFDRYKDVEARFLGDRFEAKVPTLFEYLRRAFDVPEHQALIINGEDRTSEEFYTFSNHPGYGEAYRSSVLSLYRFKTRLLRRKLSDWRGSDAELDKKRRELARLEALDYRVKGRQGQAPGIEAFWDRWGAYYGDSGLVNPRGDRLLTELALWALRLLRPKLLIVNYNDCDYVHWGNPTHYTRAIAIMDEGLRQLTAAVEADPEYRGRTIFCVAPDCGRDDNRLKAVPFQHHFNSRSAHEVFALLFGPGIRSGQVVGRLTQQIDIAPTLGRLMGVPVPHAKGEPLAEALG